MSRLRARGFSLIELAVTLVVISTLLRVAIPANSRFQRNARAVEIMRTVTILRQASQEYFADTGQWPRSRTWGQAPPELAPYLPQNLKFEGSGWRLYTYGAASPPGATGSSSYSYHYVYLNIPDAALGRVVYNSVTRKIGVNPNFHTPYQYSFLTYQSGG